MARVLLVDDDVAVAEFLIEYLEARGHEIHHASTGLEGLRLASEHRPAVILLDLTLPDAPGYDVLRRLAELDPTRPVIVLTGSVDPHVAEDVGHLGAFGLLRKPFDLRDLETLVAAALAGRAQDA